ncbi:guanosine polyphosphate pyrophosphohydrolase [Orientia tsutsugamushi]|uniref:histidine kinase n=2 Tax=Orientia tsutsugamushi TaxID=784 RepID=A0A2U3RHK7_ORITS|nr:guanosine polyphosphate pyrophosphohydrolase [Orientia tsutsugamushi]
MILEKEFDSEIEMKITKSALNAVAEYKGIKLSCDYLTTVKEVIGDNYRLQAVLIILITNAIRFNSKGSKIGVQMILYPIPMDNKYRMLKVIVNDTGPGFSKSKVDQINKEFKDTYSEEASTLGFRMKFVRQFIQEMNGEIMLKSEENKGACFIFNVPLKLANTSITNSLSGLFNNLPIKDGGKMITYSTCYCKTPVSDFSQILLNKLILINQHTQGYINLYEVTKAIKYAKKYHGQQKRDTGEPYYIHPLEVACAVAEYSFETDTIITAILHDTLEDTTLTKEKIAKVFGVKIAEQVFDLTRIRNNKKISSREMIKILRQQNKKDLLLIKLCDRLHNIQTVFIKSDEKRQKIIIETEQEFIPLARYLKLPKIADKLSGYCLLNTYLE